MGSFSGLILSIIMCKAMNRSFTNVLFGAFGQIQVSAAKTSKKRPVRSASPEEAAAILGGGIERNHRADILGSRSHKPSIRSANCSTT